MAAAAETIVRRRRSQLFDFDENHHLVPQAEPSARRTLVALVRWH